MNRRFLIIITVAVVILGVLLVLVGRNANQGPKSTTTINPITGEKIVTDHGVTPEKAGTPTVTILGAEPVYNNMSDDQFNLFREATNTYVRNIVSPKVSEVTVLPASINFNETTNVLTAKMKIDNPAKTIELKLTMYQSNYITVVFSDPSNKTTPVYNTGQMPAPNASDTGADTEGDY